MKEAKCSEPVKSRVPSIWFVWKNQDSLVIQKQNLGVKGHQALPEHSPVCSTCSYIEFSPTSISKRKSLKTNFFEWADRKNIDKGNVIYEWTYK